MPSLAQVNCSRIQFQPGDRVLVRVYETMSKGRLDRLKSTVQRWAGPGVEVLIYNCTKMEVTIGQPHTIP